MKFLKYLLPLILLTCSCFANPTQEGDDSVIARKNAVSINQTQLASCKGAWPMVTNNGSEADISGEEQTLAESTSDDLPTSSTVLSGFSGTSRDCQGTENLFRAESDGNGFDISGQVNLTICVMFSLDTYNANRGLVAKYDTSQAQYRVRYDTSDAGLNFFLSSNGSAATGTALGDTDITDSDVHSVCAVYDDTAETMQIYLDAVADHTPVSYGGGIYNGTADFEIGENGGNECDGIIDMPQIHNIAFTQAQVTSYHNSGMEGVKGAND